MSLISGDVRKTSVEGLSGGIAYVIPSDVEAFVENNQLDTLSLQRLNTKKKKSIH